MYYAINNLMLCYNFLNVSAQIMENSFNHQQLDVI